MKNSWVCNNVYSFAEQNFRKIYDFFVIKTPVEGVSIRGIPFKKRNINNLNIVFNQIKRISPTLFYHFEALTEEQSVTESLNMHGIFKHLDEPFEYAIYKIQKGLVKTDSFFYCIRCALAHGAFCIHYYKNENYYYFENIHINRGKEILNARMVIKEQTLLAIIDFCDSNLV